LITTTVGVIINGSGFKSGATVNAGTGITANVTSISGNQIHATFEIDTFNSAGGNHSVTESRHWNDYRKLKGNLRNRE